MRNPDKRHLQAPARLLNYPASLHVQQLSTAYKTLQVYWASMDSLAKPHLQDAQVCVSYGEYLEGLQIN